MKIRKNDTIKVMSGSYKDKGKVGKVLKVYPEKDRIIVEGVNIIKRHTRPSQQNQQGGIVEKEAPIHASNVMVVCPKCDTPTRMGHKILEDKKKVRVCGNCEEMLVSST